MNEVKIKGKQVYINGVYFGELINLGKSAVSGKLGYNIVLNGKVKKLPCVYMDDVKRLFRDSIDITLPWPCIKTA
jgi:hypothetical protein